MNYTFPFLTLEKKKGKDIIKKRSVGDESIKSCLWSAQKTECDDGSVSAIGHGEARRSCPPRPRRLDPPTPSPDPPPGQGPPTPLCRCPRRGPRRRPPRHLCRLRSTLLLSQRCGAFPEFYSSHFH